MDILKNRQPNVQTFTVNGGTTKTVDFGGQAGFVMIQNQSGHDIPCKFNGTGTFWTCYHSLNYVFNVGDMYLTSLYFDNTASGASSVYLEVMYSV